MQKHRYTHLISAQTETCGCLYLWDIIFYIEVERKLHVCPGRDMVLSMRRLRHVLFTFR